MDANLAIFLSLMLPGTFFLGLYDIFGKRLVQRALPEQFIIGVTFVLASLFLAPALFFTGIPTIGPGFLLASGSVIAINVVSNIAWYRALRMEDASLLAPMRLITPPLVLLTGFLFLNEVPGIWGIVGVLTTFIGLYFLVSGEAKFKNVTFKSVLSRPGVLTALACAALGAVSFSLDKKAVAESSPLFFTVVFLSGVGGTNLIAFLALSPERGTAVTAIRANLGLLLLHSAVHALGALLCFASLPFTYAAYAASTKRLWSLWAVLFAGQLLKEGNIRAKIIAVLIMLAGIALPLIWG